MKKTIDVTVGIYDTEITMNENKDGTITVKVPEIKWKNNTGTLSFFRKTFSGKMAKCINDFFEIEKTVLFDYEGYEYVCLYDLINGHYKI